MVAFFSVLGRNRAFAHQLGALAAATALMAAGFGWLWGARAAWACLAAGGVACVLFAAFSVRRYGELQRLAAQVDEVLERGRRLELGSYREGDVAILGNEVAKVVAQLARATHQLDREKRLMSDWMADVSHQIRTPLTAVSLTAAAIERAEGDAERKALGRQLEAIVDRLSWLVTALLRLAKLDADALPLEKEPVPLDGLLDDALAPLAVALDLHGIVLEVQCEPGAAFVGDRRWTAEALGNIVKNCLEHTPSGGTLRLEGREDALACRITVTDSGPGIAAEDLPHVFERFYRGRGNATAAAPGRLEASDMGDAAELPAAYAAEGPAGMPADNGQAAPPNAFNDGFGIGLSLAQGLVSAQGGTLRASNDPAGGARFDITFSKMVV